MDTTRNAETPPSFVPKTLQKWPGKLPNVASETLEKKDLLAAFEITVLSRPVALTSAATARLMDTTRNAETPPNFVPKTHQKWPGKLPNVASETLENRFFGCLWDNRLVEWPGKLPNVASETLEKSIFWLPLR